MLGELGRGQLSGAESEGVRKTGLAFPLVRGPRCERDHCVVSDSTLVRLTGAFVNGEHPGVTPPAWEGQAPRRPSVCGATAQSGEALASAQRAGGVGRLLPARPRNETSGVTQQCDEPDEARRTL